MRSQKNAVCSALLSVLADRGVDYELNNGPVNMKDVLTPEDKKTVRAIITQGFLDGEITLSEAAQAKFLPYPAELSKYVHGLVNNWIKKNKEFNGGNAYVPENKGSRTGQGDPQIKALRALKTTADAQAIAEIDEAIAARLAEIKPKVEIDVSALPERFRHLVSE